MQRRCALVNGIWPWLFVGVIWDELRIDFTLPQILSPFLCCLYVRSVPTAPAGKNHNPPFGAKVITECAAVRTHQYKQPEHCFSQRAVYFAKRKKKRKECFAI